MTFKNATPLFVCLLLCLQSVLSGCTNNNLASPVTTRQVKFVLYTNQDFSNETGSILFEPSISVGNSVLWDSTFAPMAVKDIPTEDHPIIFEKTVKSNSELKVGFRYTLEGVGVSWYYEKMLREELSKTLHFNFR